MVWKKRYVVALGGNAILRKGESPTIDTQIQNTRKALENLFNLFHDNVVLTHGNGPAVGYLLMQNELAKSKVPVMPLDVLDAETEGQIGYIIQQQLQNLFRKRRIKKGIATILTQVLVDKRDRAFRNPEKFVGPFYSKEEAAVLKKKYDIREDSGKGWRRVVPSPKPIEIIESKVIKKLMNDGVIVIAAGGGGIPVVKNSNGLRGIEAVVDKDLASACLAKSIKASIFVMVTDTDRVFLNFGKKNERGLGKIGLDELKGYHKMGHFAPGSMGPKVEAAINFLENGGEKVIITDIASVGSAIRGSAGTIVTR